MALAPLVYTIWNRAMNFDVFHFQRLRAPRDPALCLDGTAHDLHPQWDHGIDEESKLTQVGQVGFSYPASEQACSSRAKATGTTCSRAGSITTTSARSVPRLARKKEKFPFSHSLSRLKAISQMLDASGLELRGLHRC
jgi:hypothetical protein